MEIGVTKIPEAAEASPGREPRVTFTTRAIVLQGPSGMFRHDFLRALPFNSRRRFHPAARNAGVSNTASDT